MFEYIKSLFIVIWVVSPFYIIVRLLIRKKRKLKSSAVREFLLAFFVLFMTGLIALVFHSDEATSSTDAHYGPFERIRLKYHVHMTPFESISGYFKNIGSVDFMINIVGNIVMFIPLGFFLPLFWKQWWKFWKIAIVAVGFPLFIETTQLFLNRHVDIDDIILNALGVVVGYFIYKLLSYSFPKLRSIN